MRAFQNVRSQMRENAIHLTSPNAVPARPPAQVSHEPDMDEDTHIEPWMELAFKGLTHASETGEPYALVSCYMNGQPAALIAATHQRGDGTYVLPLFMAVQPGMKFTSHLGDDEGGGDEGGGPAGLSPEP
jgi:hypothetical protein